MKERVVIIGASVAGVYTATELVKSKFQGEITLIDKENVLPYNPYPLTKEWMMDSDESKPPLLKKEGYYEKHNISLKLGTEVVSVNWEEKIIDTDKEETIPYDYLVIATGSKLRKIDLPGDDAEGIFYLRSFKEAQAIKAWLKKAQDVAIIGAGFIGLEFASTFSGLGKNVSVLVKEGRPLENILGKEISDYFVGMHQDHGINFLFDEETEELVKDEEGKIKSLVTKSGKNIKCDMLIIAVGVQPNLSMALEGLKTDRGAIIVNEFGETGLPNIYAGGDIVVFPYRGRMIHIEHWENAWTQGTSIARNIMKEKSHKYTTVPYFWTDQYDETFEYLGNARTWDRILVRGSLEDKKFALAYVDENSLPLAILFANKFEEREVVEELMNIGKPLNEKKFKDPSIPLSASMEE